MLLVKLRCSACNNEFEFNLDTYRALGIPQLPRRCQACCDVAQERPTVCLSRVVLYETDVVVDETAAVLIANAIEFRGRDHDTAVRRVTVRGKAYGADWSGRIDLYSHVWPVEAGQVVHLAHMLARKRVWVRHVERTVGGMTLDARRVVVSRRCGPHDEGATEVHEDNEYVVLLPSETDAADAMPRLVWVEAYSKTTIKGFGRQFHTRIEGEPLWSQSVDGHARSGRFGTVAMLAVVDPAAPLSIVQTGDDAGEWHFPSAPFPAELAQASDEPREIPSL